MAVLVSTPAVAHATAAAWIAAPASTTTGLAWLEVGKSDGDARTVAAFRGDRLVIRTAGRIHEVVHRPCTEQPCDAVQAPVALADGTFAYAVAFPGTGGYVARATADGRSTVIAEDQTDPHEIRYPHPVATTGAGIAWLDGNRVHLAPPGRSGFLAVRSAQAGGTITAIAAGPGGIAWIARTERGGTIIGVRSRTGVLSLRASEPDASKARFASLAIADDGTVVAIRRVADGAAWRTELDAYAPDGASRLLQSSPALAASSTAETPQPSTLGSRVAVRLRGGAAGELDVVWLFDLASGAHQRVVAVKRANARISNPSLGGGRLVWARDGVSPSGGLVRSRLFVARLLP